MSTMTVFRKPNLKRLPTEISNNERKRRKQEYENFLERISKRRDLRSYYENNK